MGSSSIQGIALCTISIYLRAVTGTIWRSAHFLLVDRCRKSHICSSCLCMFSRSRSEQRGLVVSSRGLFGCDRPDAVLVLCAAYFWAARQMGADQFAIGGCVALWRFEAGLTLDSARLACCGRL